ncbi:hypothetical protein ASE03_23585 [Kitasatospora sp. Root187]|nr:hypothetical protein ASE03_23585 [Kitasatospora sp. Root187]
MSESTADVLNTVLLGVTENGGVGTGHNLGLDGGRQIAGKTGTTDQKKAAWFTGYTPNLATSVWLGGPTGGVSMRDISIGGVDYDEVFGANGPGPIWQLAMNRALTGVPEQEFRTVHIPDPAPKKDPGASPGASPSGSASSTARP